ncbi:endonuclease [Chryseomicrobium sp. FSL W7-1435]|uniref:endonuclease n=1 Tax=Chryseomicrobium sp. FSL W7-1435 TaxID=2921704 RepID=UPI00315A37B9
MKQSSWMKKWMKRSVLSLAAAALVFPGVQTPEPVSAQTTDLLISEYIEGSSNNKAIEIFNGTGQSVNLSGYQVAYHQNGSTSVSGSLNLSGTLAAGDVLVVYNPSSASGIISKGDVASTVIQHNGDDTILLKKNGTTIDSFGQIGVDPGTAWSANGVSTVDKTLVRKSTVTSGDTNATNAFDPSAQWTAYPVDTFTFLGSHQADGGTTTPPPTGTINDANGYYTNVSGLSGSALKTRLNDIIDNHTKLSYDAVWDALKYTDEDPANSSNVILFYSGLSRSKTLNGGDLGDWNREHVWAKSHGDFGTTTGAGTDLHHLRATDVQVNGARGNLDFDIGGTTIVNCFDCKKDGDSFEPPNRVKGDVARILFYMATRYEVGDQLDLELNNQVNNGTAPYHGKLSVLLQWHAQDPVDAAELRRNQRIFERQGNRNPFIDNPQWATSIFSN